MSATVTLQELFGGLADVGSAPDIEPAGVCLDSRQVQPGYLYLAIGGAVTHGLRHAQTAVAEGAIAVAFDPEDAAEHQSVLEALEASVVTLVAVPGLARLCGEIASRFHGYPDRELTLIAVTGTDGKTSVCRFITDALAQRGVICGCIGTLGWGLGGELAPTALTTPDAVVLRGMLASLKARGATTVAFEASSHGLAEGRLDGLDIDIAVLTNLGRDHLDYHIDVASYRAAKSKLFQWQSLKSVVLNMDDALGQDLMVETRDGVQRVGFSMVGGMPMPEVDIAVGAREVVPVSSGLRFTLSDGAFERSLLSPLAGRFNVANLIACYGALRALGEMPEAAANVLSLIRPVAGRMERFDGMDVANVIVDFAHTPQALSAAIEASRAHCSGKLWVVFGCGGDRDPGKRAPMGAAAEAADCIVVTDDNPRNEPSNKIIDTILEGMQSPERATVISDRSSAIRHAITTAAVDDIVLVAGKGHEDYQIVGNSRIDYSDRRLVGELLAVAC